MAFSQLPFFGHFSHFSHFHHWRALVALTVASLAGVMAMDSVSFKNAPVFINEGGGLATVPIVRNGSGSGTCSVMVSVGYYAVIPGFYTVATPGADYTTVVPISVTFADGERAKSVQVMVLQDQVLDPAEYIPLLIGGPLVNCTVGNQSTTGIAFWMTKSPFQ